MSSHPSDTADSEWNMWSIRVAWFALLYVLRSCWSTVALLCMRIPSITSINRCGSLPAVSEQLKSPPTQYVRPSAAQDASPSSRTPRRCSCTSLSSRGRRACTLAWRDPRRSFCGTLTFGFGRLVFLTHWRRPVTRGRSCGSLIGLCGVSSPVVWSIAA